MDAILRRQFVDGLLPPDSGEGYPCLALTPFSVVGLPVRGSQQNPRAGAPDASAHTLGGSTDPKSPWLPPPKWLPHTSRHCPPRAPTLAGGGESRHRTQRLGARRASAWPPGVPALWASGHGTDTTGHRPTPAGSSPTPMVPDSAGRGSPHTETPGRLAWLWRGPSCSRPARG